MEIDYLATVRREADAMIAAARRNPTAQVPSCPGWDVNALCTHTARVHRWATVAAQTGTQPAGFPEAPTGDAAIDGLADGIEPLLAALGTLRPGQPGWTFTGSGNGGDFWPRRQAHETMIHRWDTEAAVGTPSPLEPSLAADGLHEAFRVLAPFRLKVRKGGVPSLDGDLHLHATDADSEWHIHAPGREVVISNRHVKSTAALRGTASDLLLFLWRRIDPRHPGLDIVGDQSVVSAFYDWKLMG